MRNALGPDNWFDAWWLAGESRRGIAWAMAGDGRPEFAHLELDEFRFVLDVLLEEWNAGPAEWESPEWRTLERLEEVYFDLVLEMQRGGDEGKAALEMQGGGDEGKAALEMQRGADEGEAVLAMPALEHRVVATRSFERSVWRLQGRKAYDDWLEAQLTSDLRETLRARPDLRALVIELAERRASAVSFAALRAVYRDPEVADELRREDEQWCLEAGREHIADRITRMGLHAWSARKVYAIPEARESSAEAEVTVLIPAYKHEDFIADCLASCLAQTVDGIEIHVVDDQSPDRTVEVASAIEDPRITVRQNERNLGLGNSIAEALEQVSTPFVALLNSDDVLHPERLQRSLELLRDDAGACLVASKVAILDRQGQVVDPEQSCVLDVGPRAHGWLRWYSRICAELSTDEDWTSVETLLEHNVLATSSNIVARSDWLRAQAPSFRGLRYCLDWKLFLAAAIEGGLRYCDEALLGYRFHESNTVWFESGGRGGYVYEVNRVLADSLVSWLERAADSGEGRRRLLPLLHGAALRHGEADAVLLAIAFAERLLGDGRYYDDAVIDPIADRAMARRARDLALADVDEDPWALARMAKEQARHRLEGHAAEVLARRWPKHEARRQEFEEWAERLEAQRADLETRLTESIVECDRLKFDLDEERERFEATEQELRSEMVRLVEQHREQQEEFRARTAELEREIAALRPRAAELDAVEHATASLIGESASSRVARLRHRARELRVRVFELEQASRSAGGRLASVAKRARAELAALADIRPRKARKASGVVLPAPGGGLAEVDASWELEALAASSFDLERFELTTAHPAQAAILARHRRRFADRFGLEGQVDDAVAAMAWRLARADYPRIVAYGLGDAAEAARLACSATDRPLVLRVFGAELSRERGRESVTRLLAAASQVIVDARSTADRLRDFGDIESTVCVGLAPSSLLSSAPSDAGGASNRLVARGLALARNASGFVDAVRRAGLQHELCLGATVVPTPEGLEAHETLVHSLHGAGLDARSRLLDDADDDALRESLARCDFALSYDLGCLPWAAATILARRPLLVPRRSSLADIVPEAWAFAGDEPDELVDCLSRLANDHSSDEALAAEAAARFTELAEAQKELWSAALRAD